MRLKPHTRQLTWFLKLHMIIRLKIICSFYCCNVFVEAATQWRLQESGFKFAVHGDRWSVRGFRFGVERYRHACVLCKNCWL